MPYEIVELRGHIIDNHTLPRVLDLILAFGGDHTIEEMKVGHSRSDESLARIKIVAPERRQLDDILDQVTRVGAVLAGHPEVKLQKARKNGVFPDDFYATTNLPTEIFLQGRWLQVQNPEMDCGIVVAADKNAAVCRRMHRIEKGDWVVVGHAGIRVEPIAKVVPGQQFEFMNSAVSSEKPKLLVIRDIARRIRALRKAGRKVCLVGGPAIVHTGAGKHLADLIRHGFIDVLFAGNALAAHDIEAQMFGTSLGVSLSSGRPVEHGHEHHLRAINRIRNLGSIKNAVKKGLIKDGVMHACIEAGIPYVLVGSIRDDGPLPEVITEMAQAQDAMRRHIPELGIALMVGSMLLSIAVGNMLPASVFTVCVDINPAVVTKLADRGTFHAVGLVTDAELFLRQLARQLGLK